jgi:hypothetical protein
MHNQRDTETTRVEDKTDLALSLWEGLVRELIGRGVMSEAALARILDSSRESVSALSNSEELRQIQDQIRGRLERCFPTALQRIDRDSLPGTKD